MAPHAERELAPAEPALAPGPDLPAAFRCCCCCCCCCLASFTVRGVPTPFLHAEVPPGESRKSAPTGTAFGRCACKCLAALKMLPKGPRSWCGGGGGSFRSETCGEAAHPELTPPADEPSPRSPREPYEPPDDGVDGAESTFNPPAPLLPAAQLPGPPPDRALPPAGP